MGTKLNLDEIEQMRVISSCLARDLRRTRGYLDREIERLTTRRQRITDILESAQIAK